MRPQTETEAIRKGDVDHWGYPVEWLEGGLIRQRCLSVRQPWASLIASGKKRIETRTWRTSYRGPLLICSSARPEIGGYLSGYALALVKLVDIVPFDWTHQERAKVIWKAGMFAWMFSTDVIKIHAFPVKGRLGLFTIDIDPALIRSL